MDIRAAIFEEARRRGIEHKLRDEAPVHSHASLNLPHDLMDMDNQLMGLIEALEGRCEPSAAHQQLKGRVKPLPSVASTC